jgi:glycosyltransferase involved in cell wall biosynthesis
MHNRKKALFSGLDMTIVTPSQWLADLVKQSFLKDYPVKVIHNGIDLSVFRPTPSNFREKYGIARDKKILLGVAFGWGARKGLDVFIDLAHRLDPDHYQIVLVGTDENTDKQLPENIISIHRTQNQAELAEVYTAADLFVNPTREENYPTVNMEALACGTPVLTFRTGGSPEILDETCGAVVACDDVDAMEREIIRICAEAPYSEAACLKRAEGFDHNQRFEEYIHLYESGVNES